MPGKKRRTRYRRTIFAYFMAIAIVPLLILGLYSYNSAADAVRDNIRQANETALIQVENQVEAVLNSIQHNFLRIAAESPTESMTRQYYDKIPYPEVRNFIESICNDSTYINYAGGYAFINYKNQWVLSNKGMRPLSEINNRDWLTSLSERAEKMFWINRTQEEEGRSAILSEHINDHYLMFGVKIPIYTTDCDAVLLVNIKRSAFESLLSDSVGNGALTVYDGDGRLIYSQNSNVTGYYEENPDQLDYQEEQVIHTENGNYDIVKRKAAVSGWTFVASYNQSAADREVQQILYTMIGIIAAVLVLTGMIGTLGTTRVYRPVEDLVASVKGVFSKEEDDNDEFGMIHEGIHKLVGQNEALQDMIDRQKGQLSELFALRLIRGRLSESEIEQTMERLQLQFLPRLCVVSVIFCPKQDNAKTQMEQDALNLELLRRLPEEIRDILLFPAFIHTRAIVMIVDGEQEERVETKLLALRNCLSVFVQEACGGYVDMGVSRTYGNPAESVGAYRESLEALKVNEYSDRDEDTEGISLEDSSITYYADLIGQDRGIRGTQMISDGAIKEAVGACDKEKAFAVVDEFMKDMSKSGAVLYEQHYYMYRFLLAILSVPADAGIPIHDIFPKGEDDLFQRFGQLYDSQTIRKFYETSVIVPVISQMSLFRKSSSQVVLEKIEDLIRASGGDLTLAECAEKLGYHPSYIWRVMKNTKDITFTDYIAEQKLEQARQMLLTTELSVADIAERLSYSNAQNFIRLFKKHLGMTPGQFRKEYPKL